MLNFAICFPKFYREKGQIPILKQVLTIYKINLSTAKSPSTLEQLQSTAKFMPAFEIKK